MAYKSDADDCPRIHAVCLLRCSGGPFANRNAGSDANQYAYAHGHSDAANMDMNATATPSVKKTQTRPEPVGTCNAIITMAGAKTLFGDALRDYDATIVKRDPDVIWVMISAGSDFVDEDKDIEKSSWMICERSI
jgi:hypothetical protein